MAIACPICGSENQEGTGRCRSCGAPLPIMDLPEIIARGNSAAPGDLSGDAATVSESSAPPLVDPPIERGGTAGRDRVEQGPLRRTVFQEAQQPPVTPPPVPPPPPMSEFEPPPPELDVEPAGGQASELAAEAEATSGRRQEQPVTEAAPGAQEREQYPGEAATTQEWTAPQQWPWPYQPYGMPAPAPMYPWMFQYPLIGYYSPAFGFLPCPGPGGFYPQPVMPCYGAGLYGQAQYPAAAPNYPAQQAARAAPKSGRKPLLITLLVILLLLVVGGAVAAFILLTGESKSSFNLGDATAVGANVEFQDMVLRKDGDVLTLTGKYDNNTKSEGDALITVQAIGNGGTTRVTFTVPVETGTGRSFTEQSSTGPMKLTGATLGSIVFESREEYDPDDSDDTDSEPWEVEEPGDESVPMEEEQSVPPLEEEPDYQQYFEESVPGQPGSFFPTEIPGPSAI